MLQSLELQRVGHDWVTDQQQQRKTHCQNRSPRDNEWESLITRLGRTGSPPIQWSSLLPLTFG